ncbi:MAG: CHAP domain-containing protein [Gemmata sp.]
MTGADHFDRFFVLAAVGLGLALVGGVNTIWGGQGKRRALLGAAAGASVCAAVAGALAALTRGELAARAAAPLAGTVAAVTLLAAVLRSEWLSRNAARAAAGAWGLLAAGGVALAAFAMVDFERVETAQDEQNMWELQALHGQQHRQPARTRAVTDRGVPVTLYETTAARDPKRLDGPEKKFLRDLDLNEQVIRRGGADDASNCHGWLFAGGKFLLSPEGVEAALKDNGYTETHEPQPGDLVVYRRNGAIAHTAVVRYVTEGQPVLVEGKWGTLGVFLHPASRSPYGADFTFCRSGRTGHLLVGVGGVSPDPSVVVPVVTE